MNNTINTSTLSTSTNPVTAKMIAEKIGMNIGTVRQCLTKNARKYKTDTVERVRKVAREMGYDPHYAMAANAQALYLSRSNFPSMEVETSRMMILREQGYSNAEIAKMIGKGHQTVLKRIGCQDNELSNQNRAAANYLRAQKNLRRKVYVAQKSAFRMNELDEEIVLIRQRQNELMKEHEELVKKESSLLFERSVLCPRVEQAQKLAVDNLGSLNSTPLQ